MKSFAKAKRCGNLKTIRAEIFTAPSEFSNDNKKHFFSALNLIFQLIDKGMLFIYKKKII